MIHQPGGFLAGVFSGDSARAREGERLQSLLLIIHAFLSRAGNALSERSARNNGAAFRRVGSA